jgi:glutamate racemase
MEGKNKTVVFIDSGVGGIPYFRYFRRRNPEVKTAYLADRRHFPYGKRERTELGEILCRHVQKIVQIVDPKTIVLACNTASIAALAVLRQRFPELTFVGTVPAIKPAALASKTGKVGVLGTELTVRERYIAELAKDQNCEIVGIAASELVEFVETKLEAATEEEKRQIVQPYIKRFEENGADTVVLGCTHFLFLQEYFQTEAMPNIAVFDSMHGVSHRVESLLGLEPDSEKKQAATVQGRMFLTGMQPPEPLWINWAKELDCSLSMLEEE